MRLPMLSRLGVTCQSALLVLCLAGRLSGICVIYPAPEAELWALPQERQPHLVSSYISKEGSRPSMVLSRMSTLCNLLYCCLRLQQVYAKESVGGCRWLWEYCLQSPTSSHLLCQAAKAEVSPWQKEYSSEGLNDMCPTQML